MRKYATLTIAQARNPHSVPRVTTYFGHLEKIYAERRNILSDLAGRYHIWEKTGTCAECFEVFRENLKELIDRYFDDDANLKRSLREDFHFVFFDDEHQDYTVASCYYFSDFEKKEIERIMLFGQKNSVVEQINDIKKKYKIRNVFENFHKNEEKMFKEVFSLLALDILCDETKEEALRDLANVYFIKEE